MTLDGVMERIRVPFLVTHGEKDRQIALDYAHAATTSWSIRRAASSRSSPSARAASSMSAPTT